MQNNVELLADLLPEPSKKTYKVMVWLKMQGTTTLQTVTAWNSGSAAMIARQNVCEKYGQDYEHTEVSAIFELKNDRFNKCSPTDR